LSDAILILYSRRVGSFDAALLTIMYIVPRSFTTKVCTSDVVPS
jgi:hypothetical protein